MIEYKTISSVASEIKWSTTMVKYWLGKVSLEPIYIKMGKHQVRILSPTDITKLKEAREKSIEDRQS